MSQSLPMVSVCACPSRLRGAALLPGVMLLWEVAVLAICGAIAGASVGLIDLRLQIPGHSIFHTIMPMALGLSLVPRRFSGTGMSFSAALTAGGLMLAEKGEFGAGAWTSLISMGPALDLLLWSRFGRQWPALSVGVAGLLTNSCAFLAKAAEKWMSRVPTGSGSGLGGGGGRGRGLGLGLGGGHGMGGGRGLGGGMGRGRSWDEWISVAPFTYVTCGLLAGLICGIVLFHWRRRSENHGRLHQP